MYFDFAYKFKANCASNIECRDGRSSSSINKSFFRNEIRVMIVLVRCKSRNPLEFNITKMLNTGKNV